MTLSRQQIEEIARVADVCPTCSCNWKYSPPAKIHGEDMVRCVHCKAVYDNPDTINALCALALQALDAGQPVAVKPLEWEHMKSGEFLGGASAVANSILGEYQAWGEGSWVSPDGYHAVRTGSLESGKAAAQSDYEQRIKSALAPPPLSPPQERVEANSLRDSSADPLGRTDHGR
jgi:hypothetical protein